MSALDTRMSFESRFLSSLTTQYLIKLALRSRSCQRSWRASSAHCTWPPSNTWRCRNLQQKSLHWKWIKLRRVCIHNDCVTFATRIINLMGRMVNKDTWRSKTEPTPPFFHCAFANSHFDPKTARNSSPCIDLPCLHISHPICERGYGGKDDSALLLLLPTRCSCCRAKNCVAGLAAAVHGLAGR